MKFIKHIYAVSLLSASLLLLWGCNNDEETRLSDAVLASNASLTFEAQGNTDKIITVYADAAWETEIPEWVTVTPTSGIGTTDVTISVTDNMRGGAEDNPRKATLVFKGRTLASRAEVLIIQNGDKYRDVKEYTVAEIEKLADEATLSLSEATVMAVTTKGFVVTDKEATGNLYVLNETAVSVGDKVSILGVKTTDMQSMTAVECDQLNVLSTGSQVTYPQATDITDQIDTYTATTREYISVTGIYNGSTVTIKEANNGVSFIDPPASLRLSALNGHSITVKGYFSGVAEPVVRIIVTDIEDHGIIETIYFMEDFEWLDPWAEKGDGSKPAGQTVETDDLDAYAPQLPTPKITVEGQEVSALQALESKGYEFLRVTTKTEGECIYLQRNYLKFGKTSYQAGIILPKIKDIPDGAELVMSFDWCPMRQGSGKIDPVNLIIIVANGTDEQIFDVPESGFEAGHKLEWINARIPLTGATVNEETRITIRQTQWPASTANRWFLDNIKIVEK